MAECRYFPECQRCNEVGDSWLPCAGGSDGILCKGYEPMPDVKALFELADEIEDIECVMRCCNDASSGVAFVALDHEHIARRIREALGVER